MNPPGSLEQVTAHTFGSGLRFPEGPVVDADGSLIVPEIEGGALVRLRPDGTSEPVADVGGGANGCAFGPDGALYVCNSGGFLFAEADGLRFPAGIAEGYAGGWLQRVEPATGRVDTVFTESDGVHLGGLNDIVFDAHGGCYIADTTVGAIHYADPVAGAIRVAASGLTGPNGAGLSPDGTRLYVSETFTGRLRTWDVAGPGKLVEQPDLFRHPAADVRLFWDGLAVDGAGNVCVADQPASAITVIGPDGTLQGSWPLPAPDRFVTNLCFGGVDGNTAYVCSGGRGVVYALQWPWPGHRLHFQP